MVSVEDYVLAHAKHTYGARVLYRNRALYIQTEDYTYRLDLRLAPANVYRFIAIQAPIVLIDTCLARGFFKVAAHATYKAVNKIPTNADWERFLNDAYKNGVYLEEI